MSGPVPDCLLIADDLTGACDGGAPFAAAGRRAVVVLEPDADAGGARVLAVSTESRDLAPAEIPAAMAAAAARLPVASAPVVFKKIDSTLRGHTAAEIAAAMEIFGRPAAVVCPAFPAMRRVVRQGCLRIESAPDFTPIQLTAHLASEHIAAGTLGDALSRGVRMVSLDAESDADLDRIAAEIAATAEPILWAGSAGLSSALARSMGPGDWRAPKPAVAGPVLFAIGSDHPVTLAQQRVFLAARNTITLDYDAAGDRICGALAEGRHILFRIPRDPRAAEALCERLSGTPAAALVLSGGDTAALVCRALGVRSIELCDEIVPGIPRGILRGGRLDGLPAVTKAGGFGNDDALIQIADYFSCPHP